MTTLSKPLIIKSVVINSAAILLIYFTPALSHLLNFPLYLIEPMRLMLILAMVHSNRSNAYLLAITLPLFSFAVSGHPVFFKMLLITTELTLNVWLFFLLSHKIKSIFTAMLLSVILSKIAYYSLKAGLISFAVIGPGLFSTPVLIQIITTLIFSTYTFLILGKKSN
ncbi:MAG: hypothetical protein IPN08_07655 [Bacteroidales bacterium]|nr:hypothetical protein [Bacteroidales bacterium]MBK9357246.1 hypothetical protein [Bacteroidales bacterium]